MAILQFKKDSYLIISPQKFRNKQSKDWKKSGTFTLSTPCNILFSNCQASYNVVLPSTNNIKLNFKLFHPFNLFKLKSYLAFFIFNTNDRRVSARIFITCDCSEFKRFVQTYLLNVIWPVFLKMKQILVERIYKKW